MIYRRQLRLDQHRPRILTQQGGIAEVLFKQVPWFGDVGVTNASMIFCEIANAFKPIRPLLLMILSVAKKYGCLSCQS